MHWPQVGMEPRPFGIVLWRPLPTKLQRFHSSTNTFNFAIKYSWSNQYHQHIQKHCSTNTHCQSLLVVCQWYVIGIWCIFTTQCQVKVKKNNFQNFLLLVSQFVTTGQPWTYSKCFWFCQYLCQLLYRVRCLNEDKEQILTDHEDGVNQLHYMDKSMLTGSSVRLLKCI